MESGKLKHRIILQQPVLEYDSSGDHTTTWNNVAEAKAEIRALTAREQLVAEQEMSASTRKIRLRYRRAVAAMDHTWRVLFGTRVMVLIGDPVKVNEDNRELELLVEEGPKVE